MKKRLGKKIRKDRINVSSKILHLFQTFFTFTPGSLREICKNVLDSQNVSVLDPLKSLEEAGEGKRM
jgi:hypothetical protein